MNSPSTHVARRKPWSPNKPKRHSRTPQGRRYDLEVLSADGGRARRRLISPFTMPAEIANRIAAQATAEKEKAYPEPSIRPTRLDLALAEHERYALARYIEDRSMLLGTLRSGNYGDGAGGTPGWDRAPMSEALRRAQERLAFVTRHMIPDERLDLEAFISMMLPLTDAPPSSVEEFGRAICKSSEVKVCKGSFVGIVKRLSQRLHYLYQAHQAMRRAKCPQDHARAKK